ncbi:MAG: hypothetical protein M3R70_09040 [Actinomycetota bacterium]|nr:hypothetical protein [Actinomycetota bacterium]
MMKLPALAGVAFAVFSASAASRPLPTAYSSPSWSPDGRQLVFLSARGPAGEIVVQRPDGTHRKRLARAVVPTEVVWSPASRRIAYVADGRLRVIGADGNGAHKIGVGNHPAWSADGRRLAYSAGETGPILSVDVSGKDRRRLTTGKHDHSPVWSPDGKQVAFVRAATAGGLDHLYVVRADGTDLVPLHLAGTLPAWSPDGRSLAFWLKTQYGFEAAVAGADGTAARSLTRTRPAYSSPLRWSSDGHRLTFSLCPTFGPCHVDVADLRGGSVRTLAVGDEPAWAPDDGRLAFTARRNCRSAGIFVMGADGSRIRRLTACR